MKSQRENPRPEATGRGLRGSAGTAREYSTAPARLAPYSRAIIDRQRAGIEPNVYLFAGSDAWNQAEHRRRTHGEGSALVLPPGDDPHSYRWPRLDAITAIPSDCDGERFRGLVLALLAAGTRCVVEIRPDPQHADRCLAPTCHYANADDARRAA